MKADPPDYRGPSSGTVAIRPHFRSVDGLRGLAIGLVLVFHFWQQTWTGLRLDVGGLTLNFNVLAETGFIGVQLFFVLSGFCIAWPYTGEKPFSCSEFVRRRAAKILPSYWLCLAIIALAFSPAHLQDDGIWWRHLTLNLGFLQLQAPEYLYHSFNSVLWSLAVEVHFYLLFLLSAPVWLRWSRVALGLSVVIWAGYGFWMLHQPMEEFDLYRHRLWPHLPYFAVGVALATYHRGSMAKLPSLLGLLGVGLTLGVAVLLYQVRYDPPLLPGTRWPSALEMLLVPVLAAGFGLMLLAGLQSLFWRSVYCFPGLPALGLISYNLYLWHQWLIVQLKQANIPPLGGIPFGEDPQWQLAMWATALTLSLAWAWLLTWKFEEPLRQRLVRPRGLGLFKLWDGAKTRVLGRFGPNS